MGAVIIVALVLVVIHLAKQGGPAAVDPNAGMRQSLGPDTSVPATGQTTPISPAMGGGSPQMAGPNQLRLMTNFKITALNAARVALAPPTISNRVLASDPIGPTQADSSLPTQDVAPTVGYKIPGAGLVTNTSTLVRKL